MKKEEFKRLLKEHGQISVGINAFDPSEISATYSMFFNGDVYEVFDDNTFNYLFNIDNEDDLQKFSEDILQDVVSHSHETNFDRCVEFIKNHLEHWEIEKGWDYIGKRMGLPNELAGRIYDLIDEFTEDYELTDDWWNDYEVEDFFMEIPND